MSTLQRPRRFLKYKKDMRTKKEIDQEIYDQMDIWNNEDPMLYITKDRTLELINLMGSFRKYVHRFYVEYQIIRYKICDNPEYLHNIDRIIDFQVDKKYIRVNCSAMFTSTVQANIPIGWLWNPNWRTLARAKARAEYAKQIAGKLRE